jgi:hypothetical protein
MLVGGWLPYFAYIYLGFYYVETSKVIARAFGLPLKGAAVAAAAAAGLFIQLALLFSLPCWAFVGGVYGHDLGKSCFLCLPPPPQASSNPK